MATNNTEHWSKELTKRYGTILKASNIELPTSNLELTKKHTMDNAQYRIDNRRFLCPLQHPICQHADWILEGLPSRRPSLIGECMFELASFSERVVLSDIDFLVVVRPPEPSIVLGNRSSNNSQRSQTTTLQFTNLDFQNVSRLF